MLHSSTRPFHEVCLPSYFGLKKGQHCPNSFEIVSKTELFPHPPSDPVRSIAALGPWKSGLRMRGLLEAGVHVFISLTVSFFRSHVERKTGLFDSNGVVRANIGSLDLQEKRLSSKFRRLKRDHTIIGFSETQYFNINSSRLLLCISY